MWHRRQNDGGKAGATGIAVGAGVTGTALVAGVAVVPLQAAVAEEHGYCNLLTLTDILESHFLCCFLFRVPHGQHHHGRLSLNNHCSSKPYQLSAVFAKRSCHFVILAQGLLCKLGSASGSLANSLEK